MRLHRLCAGGIGMARRCDSGPAHTAAGARHAVRALGGLVDPERLVESLDGLFFTGSPSNLEPGLYGGEPSAPGTLHDPQRDATTLPLLRLAIARGVPLFCVCRGLQELNVALGGTLHQRVHEVPGMLDHRDDDNDPRELQYALAHEILVEEGGILAELIADRRPASIPCTGRA